jgi:hypothetical protein
MAPVLPTVDKDC